MTLNVSELATLMAVEYRVPEAQPVEPFVVKHIIAPTLASVHVTDWVVVYVPVPGEQTGVAARLGAPPVGVSFAAKTSPRPVCGPRSCHTFPFGQLVE